MLKAYLVSRHAGMPAATMDRERVPLKKRVFLEESPFAGQGKVPALPPQTFLPNEHVRTNRSRAWNNLSLHSKGYEQISPH
jgi:hypothetical protein